MIDSVGAAFSIILLGVVLPKLESIFGIPKSILYILASFPVVFMLFDFYSYTRKVVLKLYLFGIAMMNLLYCFLSIGLALFNHYTITHWGWLYLLLEVIIIMLLAFLELKVAKRISSEK
ncbi:hypothetical protein [Maribacter sp. 2210JD10-5]|uniref:hypothetical protein n=1 Tax=Maribacter sp. 2210JD10-5 TaxID=3386272 RepID=UPI0039BD6B32